MTSINSTNNGMLLQMDSEGQTRSIGYALVIDSLYGASSLTHLSKRESFRGSLQVVKQEGEFIFLLVRVCFGIGKRVLC